MDQYSTDVYEQDGVDDYDLDYEEQGPPAPKLLWGRIAVLAGLVLVAFIIGRVSAPDGIPAEQLAEVRGERDAARDQAAQLEARNSDLEDRNDRLSQQLRQANAAPAEEQPADGEEITFRIYEVEPGDNLTQIATRFYDDADLASCIADFNDIDNENQLEIGSELRIPPEEEC